MATFILDLDDPNDVYSFLLEQVIFERFNYALSKSIPAIQNQVRAKIKNAIIMSDTYQQIISGPLKGELGVVNGVSKLAKIINQWTNSLTIDYEPYGSTKRGVFTLTMIQGNFDDVINLPEAHFISERAHADIRWLDWLLTKGRKRIIKHFYYTTEFDRRRHRSRTGLGVMIHETDPNWRVPDDYAGTVNNNWITKVVTKQLGVVNEIIQTEISKNFNG